MVAGITQGLEQGQAVLLCERLAPGHTDVSRGKRSHTREHLPQVLPLTAVERVLGIAVLAPQRTPGEPNEHGWPTNAIGLTLDGEEDFGELDARSCALRSQVRFDGGSHGTGSVTK